MTDIQTDRKIVSWLEDERLWSVRVVVIQPLDFRTGLFGAGEEERMAGIEIKVSVGQELFGYLACRVNVTFQTWRVRKVFSCGLECV